MYYSKIHIKLKDTTRIYQEKTEEGEYELYKIYKGITTCSFTKVLRTFQWEKQFPDLPNQFPLSFTFSHLWVFYYTRVEIATRFFRNKQSLLLAEIIIFNGHITCSTI